MLIATLLIAGQGLLGQSGDLVIEQQLHHLGNDAVAEWTDSAVDPEGFRLDLTFQGAARESEAVLLIFHNDVDDRWRIELNGHSLGTLTPVGAEQSLVVGEPGPLGVNSVASGGGTGFADDGFSVSVVGGEPPW